MNGAEPSLAMIGCGYATRLHSKTLGRYPDVRRFYASRSLERARQATGEHDGAGAFGSYEEAFASDEVDAVVIATPPSTHAELALAALEAGKHVVVEKPPFLTSAELARVAEAASTAGRRVMVAENYFYKPLVGRLREQVEEGVIGRPLFLHLRALKEQDVPEDDWRGASELAGGGALFEGGIHWISLAASIGLELEEVEGLRPGSRDGLERSLMVTLRYREGAVGALYHSWEVPSLFKGLRISRIWGREGSLTFESNGLFLLVRGRRKRLIFPGLRDIAGYRAMWEDFVSCLRSGAEPRYSLDHAARDLRLVEQAVASAERTAEDP